MSSTNFSTELEQGIVEHGYAFVPASVMRDLLERCGRLADWPEFAASWNQLALDSHMADHGRYRRRRHAVFAAAADGAIARSADQPHFQALDYNPLNGGIERWFEPIDARFGEGRSMQAILAFCRNLFDSLSSFDQLSSSDQLSPSKPAWHIEAHQFRIEAVTGESALPTPEGMHRDGVDFVLVLLVCRRNINSGTTMIGSADGGFVSSFTLTEPFDAALVDDHRVYHGVTPVEPLDPAKPAYRDVLVVTFRRA